MIPSSCFLGVYIPLFVYFIDFSSCKAHVMHLKKKKKKFVGSS